jgi:stress response protein SCP2
MPPTAPLGAGTGTGEGDREAVIIEVERVPQTVLRGPLT